MTAKQTLDVTLCMHLSYDTYICIASVMEFGE